MSWGNVVLMVLLTLKLSFRTVADNILGPVVQNLTKLLANVTFKFLSWNIANTLIFFAEKMWVPFALQKLLTFFSKNINVFENTLAATVNKCVINECH